MTQMLKIIAAAAAGMLVAGAAPAQQSEGLLTEHSVSLNMALAMAQEAMARCKRDGFNVSVAVVNKAGETVVLLRNDNASLHNTELARRKAYTARTFRRTSLDWAQGLVTTPALAAQRDLAQVIALGGGVPIMFGEEPIGGIGVSGATTQEADDVCAKAGLAKVADRLQAQREEKR
ncbi:MAG: hypothetical protein QOF32_2197 [Gammaproteobacteria bacterium]|jgi:uncharacterized protein GlcG (DUF336 family)|nr:hypothetical protein [Gammaproteobacteria bacterium]